MGATSMRITGLTTTVVAVPFRLEERWAFGGRRGLTAVLLELETDEGVVGLAEAAGYPSPEIVLAVFRSLEPLVVGEDPRRIERIINRIDVVGTWHHVKGTSPAIAAVETACWDLLGKVCGQPVVNLLGGRVRDRAEYLWYLARTTPEETAAQATEAVEAGFSTLYLKVGWGDPAADVAFVAAIREAVGPQVGIRVDANEAWSTGEAIRIVRQMEAYGLELVEQPTSGRNLTEMAYLRGRLETPLLANEASWTRQDVLEVVRHGAADVVSVDHQMDGGLLNMKRAAAICDAAGTPVLKHSLGELGVATYAGLHVIAATPNFLRANQAYGSFLADDVLDGMDTLPYEDGHLRVPDGPGLGVSLDRDKVARYAETYRREGAAFAFHDPDTLGPTPMVPKR
jgi:L-alanine-DL-glutamate epimerase-like enolase superfamily enzyme